MWGIGPAHFSGIVGFFVGIYVEHYQVIGGGALINGVYILTFFIGVLGLFAISPVKGPPAWFLTGFGLGAYGGTMFWPPPPPPTIVTTP